MISSLLSDVSWIAEWKLNCCHIIIFLLFQIRPNEWKPTRHQSRNSEKEIILNWNLLSNLALVFLYNIS